MARHNIILVTQVTDTMTWLYFLLSAAARTISLKAVFKMGEDKAYETFRKLRWPATHGEAICSKCGCIDTYAIASRRQFECAACKHHFSVTSGTIFASRKLSFTDLLAAIVIFVNGAKGVSALQVSRDLDVQYKTAFVLSHKLREAMAREDIGRKLSGTVESDGAYFGGYVKPANHRELRRNDRRFLRNQFRQAPVGCRTFASAASQSITFVGKSEAEGVAAVTGARLLPGSIVHADDATHWDAISTPPMRRRRINHSECYSRTAIACTNQAECRSSARLRRAGDRYAPSYRRALSQRLCVGDVMARGQPPDRQWFAGFDGCWLRWRLGGRGHGRCGNAGKPSPWEMAATKAATVRGRYRLAAPSVFMACGFLCLV